MLSKNRGRLMMTARALRGRSGRESGGRGGAEAAHPAARVHRGMAAAAPAFHAVVLLAPWTFTWAGLTVAVVMAVLAGQFGLGLGYHRQLCHRSFRTVPLLRHLFCLLGVLAFQRGPLTWCSIHRLH